VAARAARPWGDKSPKPFAKKTGRVIRAQICTQFWEIKMARNKRDELPQISGLNADEQALFREVLRSMGTNYWKAGDIPMIAEYVRALHMAETLAARIAACESVDDMRKLLDMRDREARRAAALARTLRLAPQSREDRHGAAVKARAGLAYQTPAERAEAEKLAKWGLEVPPGY
jgi:hypothetical protein